MICSLLFAKEILITVGGGVSQSRDRKKEAQLRGEAEFRNTAESVYSCARVLEPCFRSGGVSVLARLLSTINNRRHIVNLRNVSVSTRPILTASMSDPAPSAPSDSKSVNVVIKGAVQGVFYRKWTVDAAQNIGLNGWVRNLPDGSVEAVLSGPSSAVDTMIQQCHSGPSGAKVSSVDVSNWNDEVPQGFEKRKE